MTLPLNRQYQQEHAEQTDDLDDVVRRLTPQWQKQVFEVT